MPTPTEIITRIITGRCPKCGERGLFVHWFRLQRECKHCGLSLAKEDGFYLGTTSIGYVLAIVVVLIPICVLVVSDVIGVWLGVTIAILGSLILVAALYPVMLCVLLVSYYLLKPQELEDEASAEP
ncbi:MAG: DUF983 domain-containing protein [Verrucomicrobiota bacterium]